MSTITKIFIIGASLFFFGCLPKETPSPVIVTDNVTVEEKTWTSDQYNYWVTIFFTRMSHDPNVRLRYQPENLYNICKCIMDVLSTDYDYDTFIKDFNKNPVHPTNARIVYDVSFKCSVEETQLMRLQIQEQLNQEPDPKDAI